MNNIAIFASGSGTNAQNIIEYFKDNNNVVISRIYSNNKNAYVLERASAFNIATAVFNRNEFYKTNNILHMLLNDKTDLIVLAGFLWLVPQNILRHYPNKIINIHPALLPKYGGKGMYGMFVHEAVINSGDKESGISIHYVNEKYDEGEIIFQSKCRVEKTDTPEILASKIHQLEYEHFPEVIEQLLK
jgi:phosphoribosylglycinamide formyltransferase-1